MLCLLTISEVTVLAFWFRETATSSFALGLDYLGSVTEKQSFGST